MFDKMKAVCIKRRLNMYLYGGHPQFSGNLPRNAQQHQAEIENGVAYKIKDVQQAQNRFTTDPN